MNNDGGPAYPVAFTTTPLQGMSLRDHFAGLAMQGWCMQLGIVGGPMPTDPDIARYAYELADAMLEERSK